VRRDGWALIVVSHVMVHNRLWIVVNWTFQENIFHAPIIKGARGGAYGIAPAPCCSFVDWANGGEHGQPCTMYIFTFFCVLFSG
jgi:hypothetical protein